MLNLSILLSSDKCQLCWMVWGCKHKAHLCTPAPLGLPCEIRYWQFTQAHAHKWHAGGYFPVALAPLPLCTKEQITVLLLGCCPAGAPSNPPGSPVLVSPPHGDGRDNRPSGHPGGAAPPEQLLWPADSHLTSVMRIKWFVANICKTIL